MSDRQGKIQTAFRLSPEDLKKFKIILLKKDERAQDLLEAFVLDYIEKNKDYL